MPQSSSPKNRLDEDRDPATSYAEWRQRVAAELDVDDIDQRLSYRDIDGASYATLHSEATFATAEDPAGLPGVAPFTRGTRLPARDGWTIGHEFATSDPRRANDEILAGLELGAGLIWLNAQSGSGRGIRWHRTDDIEAALAGVEPQMIDFVIDGGALAPEAALLWLDWARRGEHDLAQLNGSLAIDPLAALATEGRLPGSLDDSGRSMAAFAWWCSKHAPGVRAVAVASTPYHDAGASLPQQLAFSLATGVEYLRWLSESNGDDDADAGDRLDVEQAAGQILFVHDLGRDLFMETARLRAMRLLWSKALMASGAPAAAARQRHHARGSNITISRVDPWLNMLRASGQIFAGSLGGADSITTPCYDQRLGQPAASSRRVAINSQHVLTEESYLGRVTDPGGGSWLIESLTVQLARQAWRLFQDIEAEGGMSTALLAGGIHRRLEPVAAEKGSRLASRHRAVVGVSVFPNLDEKRPERTPIATHEGIVELPIYSDWTSLVASLKPRNGPVTVEPLEPVIEGACYEELRRLSDSLESRPHIFLANLGSLSDHRARTEFAAGLFVAGGVVADDRGSFDQADGMTEAFGESPAEVAVLCSSNAVYAERAAEAARALKAAGARRVYLAGRPGDDETELRMAGVDEFIFLGCDVAACLERLHDLLGKPS